MILLDTNVISELMRLKPDSGVLDWVAGQPAASLYTTSITQAEILYGLMQLPTGRRRRGLEAAAKAMFDEDFRGRNAQIAAIARVADATLATRNVADFEGCDISLANPWDA